MPFSFFKANDQRTDELESVFKALDKVQAIIWFDPQGNILDANDNFLAALGYTAEEIVGQHHRLFVDAGYAASSDYAELWEKLGRGEFVSGEFSRLRKDGQTIYIEASYNPVFDDNGKVAKIVKFAIDVTDTKVKASDAAGQLTAISRSQAVIAFDLDGIILEANDNFLNAMGYSLDEVVGQHHRIFVDASDAKSDDYRRFWADLAAGKFFSAEYKRHKKNGEAIWIQASYNPILGPDGKPYKVVKYATDITAIKRASADNLGRIEAMSRSQAMIEFEPDGTIIDANQNFLDTTGYTLDEIKGKNHAIFVHPDYAASAEFKEFWSDLARGEFKASEFQRFTKSGDEIWLQATYNPILDPEGKPYRVVKYATNITEFKQELGVIVNSLTALSKGDLTLRLSDTGSQDFSEMRAAFNATLDKLGELVGDINFSATSIQEESESIADSAKDLSNRCERQAATVEETSASMEEMSTTVKSNAENAKDATSAAQNATNHAEQGGEIVQEAIAAMEKIEAGSAEVRKIIEVIDAIAFQTNLLALNAGVEAARAGEAGSGFAVVASEVRALAQRASESARDISALIESSERQVSEGAALVKKTGDALDEIVAAVTRVSSGIDEIFTASSEQASGVTEINQAMSDIDSTTQKTAAISEESTAAAASLAQRATSLRNLVSFFQVTTRAPAAVPSDAPVVPAPERKVPVAASPVLVPEADAPQVAPPVAGQLALEPAAMDDDDDWREF